MSSQWLLCLSGHRTSLSNAEFRDYGCSLVPAKSSLCASHNEMKMYLLELFRWSGFPAKCDVLFAGDIPLAGLFRIEREEEKDED